MPRQGRCVRRGIDRTAGNGNTFVEPNSLFHLPESKSYSADQASQERHRHKPLLDALGHTRVLVDSIGLTPA